MLSKEECLKKAKELSYGWHIGDNEFVPLKDVNKLIREIYSIKPYKFEDLKADMYLYDIKKNEIIYLFKPLNWDPTKGLRYSYGKIDHAAYGFYMDFEENRFYPVQMANARCE